MVISVALMILPDALKSAAEAAVALIYSGCEGGVFTCPLSADGSAPATHWAAAPIVTGDVLASIESLAGQEPFASLAHLRTCEPLSAAATFQALRTELGLHHVDQE